MNVLIEVLGDTSQLWDQTQGVDNNRDLLVALREQFVLGDSVEATTGHELLSKGLWGLSVEHEAGYQSDSDSYVLLGDVLEGIQSEIDDLGLSQFSTYLLHLFVINGLTEGDVEDLNDLGSDQSRGTLAATSVLRPFLDTQKLIISH